MRSYDVCWVGWTDTYFTGVYLQDKGFERGEEGGIGGRKDCCVRRCC